MGVHCLLRNNGVLEAIAHMQVGLRRRGLSHECEAAAAKERDAQVGVRGPKQDGKLIDQP